MDFYGKKPKIKVERLKQPLSTSRDERIRRQVRSEDRKGLWGLFKFITGFDKKKTFQGKILRYKIRSK